MNAPNRANELTRAFQLFRTRENGVFIDATEWQQKAYTRVTDRSDTVLTTQVVLPENSTKSPTAYRKQKSTIRNEWKFRNKWIQYAIRGRLRGT